MSHVDILLPFGLPAPAFAPDLLRTLHAPALGTLIARANTPATWTFDPFSRSLPHESWLAGQLGLAWPSAADSSPALAAGRMRKLGLSAEDGIWFMAQPVHIHVARDQLVLTDFRSISLSEPESRALFEVARALFKEDGKALQYGSTDTWFARADDWHGLQTSTPDAACGHNIDIWMPKGEGERAWRKLHNEVQMAWHEHAVNRTREEQGLPAINALWLWGAADAGLNVAERAHAHEGDASGRTGIDCERTAMPMLTASTPGPHLLVLDHLIEAALAEDWAAWLERMHSLEEKWFAPLLNALKDGKIASIKLVAGHHAQLREFRVTRPALLKFWARPSLARFLP